MRNLSLRNKFILVVLLSCLPTIAATYLLAKESTRAIHFNELEVIGAEFLKPVFELHKLIAHHKLLMIEHNAKDTDVSKTRRKITQSMNAIDLANLEHGGQLHTAEY